MPGRLLTAGHALHFFIHQPIDGSVLTKPHAQASVMNTEEITICVAFSAGVNGFERQTANFREPGVYHAN